MRLSASTGATREKAHGRLPRNQYDVVVRYQGGNNAGHTVVNEHGKFALNLLPSGIFRPQTLNVLGTGVVIDLEHLCGELERVRERACRSHRIISASAIVPPVCMPFHRWQDQLEGEKRLGAAKIPVPPCAASPV